MPLIAANPAMASFFRSYRHDAEPVDLVITKAALHHLPDFWEQIALLRINRMVKIGGLLYIQDVVFHFLSEYACRRVTDLSFED